MEYLSILLAYVIGSVPTAIVVARALGLADPRTIGSGNPGTTNLLRYGGKTAAALTLAGDVLKGVLAVLLARLVSLDPWIVVLSGFAVFLGHLYPIFFGFRGGKGVATALGVWLVALPVVAALLIATWLFVAVVFRYSSLAALVAAGLAPLYVWWTAPVPAYLALAVGVGVLLIWRHRDNVRKLVNGTERRIQLSRRSAEDR